MGGSFKSDMPQLQEKVIPVGQSNNRGQMKRLDAAAENGYNIPVLARYDGGMGGNGGNVHADGMLGQNGNSMYHPPGYDYSYPSAYCTHPQGPYMGTGATGYGGAQFGTIYQKVSPPMMQYHSPPEQEGAKPDMKKVNSIEAGQVVKSKPGLRPLKLGRESGYKATYVPSETPTHWGVYPGPTNGGFYGSTAPYEYYTQQWQSSQEGFQPLLTPQNVGVHVPAAQGGGPGPYHDFPRVHSSLNMSGRFPEGYFLKGGFPTQNWRVKEAGKGGVVQNDQAQRPAMANKFNVVPFVHEGGPLGMAGNNPTSSINRNDYNKEDFPTSYEAAKFFVIKSYSEDDVHKSIKYSVWSSTPNGNKRLDEAYRTAQESRSPSALSRVFFFFSVNCSGQFCGVAEMVGPVDFNKNMDFWLQGKWNGCLLVKWHIIKDVPHGHFRHIILSNNENKPVTNSRDTQEVHFHQGLEMLKIFKYFPMRTSLLDDFGFYDGRQRVMQERKVRQQPRQQMQVVRQQQIKEKVLEAGSNVAKHSRESVRIQPDEAESGKIQGERPQVEGFAMRVADLNVNNDYATAVEVSQDFNNGGPERDSQLGVVAAASKSEGDRGGACEWLSIVERVSKVVEESSSKGRGDNGGSGEKVSKVKAASKMVEEPASNSRGDSGGTGERVSKVERASKMGEEQASISEGVNEGTVERVSKVKKAASKVGEEEAAASKSRGGGESISKVGKEVAFKSRGDKAGTGERISKVAKAASKAGEEATFKSRGGNGGTCKNTSSNKKLVIIPTSTTDGNTSSSEQGASSVSGKETPPASNEKDDVSRIVINYKKALLEGIPGNDIVLDQTIGA